MDHETLDASITYDSLRGLWEREVITYYDGRTDSSKRIYWMQARTIYADIRIPKDLPEFRPDVSLATLTDDEMLSMAQCAGFGGTLELRDAVSEWTRIVDWQPDSGVEDIATLAFDGPDLIEDGGACGGHQIWRRRSAWSTPTLGLLLRDEVDGRTGVLVAMEDRFTYVRGRRVALAPAFNLETHVRGELARDVAAAKMIFDAEVSYGAIDEEGRLRIELSSLPWRVGDELARRSDFAGKGDVVVVGDRAADGRATSRRWQVVAREDDTGPTSAASDVAADGVPASRGTR